MIRAPDLQHSLRAHWRSGPHIPGLVLFLVVALAMLGSVAVIFTTVEAERTQRAQAVRTGAVLVSLNDIVRATMNGETGQRGYFITADKRYLEPYWFGRSLYRPAIARLRSQLGTDLPADQRQLVDKIERLSDAKWAEMDDTVGQIERGEIIAAHTRILSDEGQLAMLALRDAVAGMEGIERGKLNEAASRSAAAEARIIPALGALFVVIVAALALGLWQVVRTAHAEAAAANAEAISAARDRADLLAQELNHRVKNLFAVILAIVRMTGKSDPAAKHTVDRISQRIHALVTAHDVSQGALGHQVADLADLVATAIAPYRSDSERCKIAGESLMLPARLALPIGLVLHELVTNAVKYGAWSQPGGLLKVTWQADDDRVRLVWEELGEPAAERDEDGEGFGSQLIRSSARQLDGTIERRYEARGIVVEFDFPLKG